MRKKILALLMVGGLMLGLAGCGNDSVDKTRFISTDEVYVIDRGHYRVVIDRQTKNKYLVSTTSKEIIPMYDEDRNIEKEK